MVEGTWFFFTISVLFAIVNVDNAFGSNNKLWDKLNYLLLCFTINHNTKSNICIEFDSL